ncbi:MAG: 16S rRNA (cytosine(967)-C(5))-methyltransferase RsmB [Peptoniphilaceae bacterium]|nr:16S rRNA (cytosine(967)-C(5))-methyltransferase RsmB [Peptoniphilaceae bacterium]MDY3738196.1 16S rRNA (cytosine(967)-C(5))-methyltransferase RsmB [Peptoniphilaceae bacterium]
MDENKACLDIIKKVVYNNFKSSILLNSYRNNKLNYSYILKVVYGVLENKIYLDYMIQKLSSKKINKLERNVLVILEIGLYNLFFLRKKDYAIVNNIVNFTKLLNKKSAGFVNAILRNAIRKEKEIKDIKESGIDYISIKNSHPIWMIKYLNLYYDLSFLSRFTELNNGIQRFSIRVNRLKITKENLIYELEKLNFKLFESKISDNCIIIKNPNNILETSLFKEGYFSVQSEPSAKVVEILNPKENSVILDLCAAPGSKTSYIAEYTNNNSSIIANDIIEKKLELINQNIKRLKLENITLTNYDASTYIKNFENTFDYILLDLPCSGLGVIGRKPEIKYNRKLEDIKNISILQKEIIFNAVKYLKKGGTLVYSTCTLGNMENEENFYFIKNISGMEHIKIDNKDFIKYTNVENGTDGFFICKFKKR